AGRTLGLDRREHGVELLHHIRRKRIGAGIGAVEQQPGDAVGIARQLEVLVGTVCRRLRPEREDAIAERGHDLGIHGHTASISMAPPSPPPMHSVATPRLVPSRFIVLTRCSTMRLPEVPTGWPSEMAPPSTLSFS